MGNRSSNPSLNTRVLSDLRKHTAFSEEELQQWYKDFKRDCPKGSLSRPDFLRVYGKFFPTGDPTKFTEHVFRTFDSDRSGTIDFREFMCGMSILMKGSATDKLSWIFSLFDVDRNGFISKVEMAEILQAIDRMIGKGADRLSFNESLHSPEKRTDIIFDKADKNNDGMLSKEEFMEAARTDSSIMEMLQISI